MLHVGKHWKQCWKTDHILHIVLLFTTSVCCTLNEEWTYHVESKVLQCTYPPPGGQTDKSPSFWCKKSQQDSDPSQCQPRPHQQTCDWEIIWTSASLRIWHKALSQSSHCCSAFAKDAAIVFFINNASINLCFKTSGGGCVTYSMKVTNNIVSMLQLQACIRFHRNLHWII